MCEMNMCIGKESDGGVPVDGYCIGGGIAFLMNGMASSHTERIIHNPRNPSGPAKRSYPLFLQPPNGKDCDM